MTINIIPGARWGRRPWAGPVHAVPTTERQHFLVHYDGGSPITRTGKAIPQAVDKEHHGNGWAGIGYNFLVDQEGNIYEGRGWNLVGAHCPNFNRNGIGVQVAIGGSQEPSEAAKAAVVALHAEASRLAGKKLAKSYHGEHFSTSCAGSNLIPWVKAGMPLSGAQQPVQQASPVPSVPAATAVKPAMNTSQIAVDGVWGKATTSLWQKVMGTPVDGIVSKPSALIRGVQHTVGSPADGLLGPVTWRAIQRHIGVTADGVPGPVTIKALQRRLNTGRF